MTDTMLPQSQPTTVPTSGKLGSATLTPITPPSATTRHAGDALWPWLLGLVLLGGLGYLAFRAANARPKDGENSPGLPVGGGEAEGGAGGGEAESDEDDWDAVGVGRSRRGGGLTSFASARPARLKYPPKGYRRGARVRRLSEEQFTRPSSSRYNLEVEE